MRINHNIAALNTYNKLTANTAATSKSLEKLSSGLKINKAGDNAAGLAISEKMRGQIRGLDQASTNASDAISLIGTAEGALSETHSILQRMRELAVQSSNDTNVTIDREEIQKEMNQLTSEINRIGNTTEFNTQTLLDGTKTATEATSAKAVGVSNLAPSIEFSASATSGYAQGSNLSFGINLHNAYGASATGNTDLSAGPNVVAGANELTLTVDGSQKTISLTVADHTGDVAAFLTDVNNQLDAAFGAGNVIADLDADDHLQLTTFATGAGHSITIDGGAAAGALFGANWATTDLTLTDSADANNVLTFEVDGAAKSITIAQGTYNNITTLTNAVQAGIVAAGGALDTLVEADSNGNALMLKSLSTGATSAVDTFGGSGQNVLGFASATEVAGNTASNAFSIEVDGTTKNITLEEQTYTDSTALAGMLQAKINEAFGEDVISVKVESGKLALETTSKDGTTSGIEITGGGFTVATGLAAIGADVDVQGTDGQNTNISFQIGANTNQSMSIQISDMRSKALKISGTTSNGSIISKDGSVTATLTSTMDVTNGTTNTPAEYALDVSTHDKATKAITIINDAIESVSAERSKLGSYQNRLEHTINNLGTSSENLTTAESRIRDVDMAKEMMEFTKNNILSQAAQSMLAQANQQPQGVLQLLQ
ncbi:hypothetical protein DSECCO2_123850 [anaerobic digester metagenome]